ncbi:hypothetical protein PAXINDRAFT_89113 [Paxillus involutus ATCC 200175]|uniref:Peptidase A2 domain-containing protein n=1 Tax=Paxillus involutus ATCC 200175 TaxID=664439 RepID=A0A0C9TB42_PAXIN|nr:hypothetical protein PAXINDRAFT_89113 [Paxillus involutus ATCC 200175]
MRIPISLFATSEGKIVDTHGLLDCGAGANLIDHHFVLKHRLPRKRLAKPLIPRNVDQTNNVGGAIKYTVTLTLRISDTEEKRTFLVMNCGKENLIL